MIPEPFNTGYLSRDAGHKIFYHEYGNPNGDVIINFHGGPGTFSKAKHAKDFDLDKQRVILFDQRGSGKSEFLDRFENNDLAHIVDDVKALLDHLGVAKTHIVTGSWGGIVAIAFAKKYPDMVNKMILHSVMLARPQDIEWLVRGWRIFYPDIYQYVFGKGQTLDQYYQQMNSDNLDDVIYSTKRFGSFERNLGSLNPSMDDSYIPGEDHINSYKIYMHFVFNNFTVTEPLLENIENIADIPLTIIHNRLDFNCPPYQAWDLHNALPKSKLIIVDDIGHKSDKLESVLKEQAFQL